MYSIARRTAASYASRVKLLDSSASLMRCTGSGAYVRRSPVGVQYVKRKSGRFSVSGGADRVPHVGSKIRPKSLAKVVVIHVSASNGSSHDLKMDGPAYASTRHVCGSQRRSQRGLRKPLDQVSSEAGSAGLCGADRLMRGVTGGAL